MRIGFFVWEYPPRVVGGLGSCAENICQAMINSGHDVSLFTMNDGTLKTREVLKGVDVNRPMLVDGSGILPQVLNTEDPRRSGTGIKFFNDVLIYNILSATKFVNELMKKEGYEFDIICAYDWLSAIAGIIVKRETGLPFVFHLNSTEWSRSSGEGSETVIHVEEAAANAADRIITVCYPMYEYLIMHGFDARKINVCWNSVNLDKYDPNKVKEDEIQELRKRYGVGLGDKMLLFVGGLATVRGIRNLLEAMCKVTSKHPEAKLVILGKGDLERRVSDLIADLNLGEGVKTRFEFVSEEERILHYGASDMVVCPSLYEPCSIISLEAMAMEKPVVIGSKGICCSCDHVSGDEKTGVHVDGNNSADIAWGINSLLDDMEMAKEMGKRGRERLKKYFTWDKIAEHTIAIYKDVVTEVGGE
jgi:glycosyltransferase involved in cell wall biosynthesis